MFKSPITSSTKPGVDVQAATDLLVNSPRTCLPLSSDDQLELHVDGSFYSVDSEAGWSFVATSIRPDGTRHSLGAAFGDWHSSGLEHACDGPFRAGCRKRRP